MLAPLPRSLCVVLWLSLPLVSWAQEAKPAAAPRRLPGVQAGGQVLLPTQWSLKPAGAQVKLGDFPVNIAVHPTEPFAAVLHAGFGDHEIMIVALREKDAEVVSRVTVPQAFYGLAFSPDGKELAASGGEYEVVHRFAFDKGYLSNRRELAIAKPTEKFVPSGLAYSRSGEKLFAACPWGDRVTVVPLAQPDQLTHIAFEKDDYPYAALPTADGKRLYVSLWGRAAVAVVNLDSAKVEAVWPASSHPTELTLSPDESLLYVACANSNAVHVFDVKEGRQLEVFASSLYPQAPTGSTPNSLALSPDGKVLLIANADNNNVAVIDVSRRGQGRSLGYIPAGWYPTSVRFTRDGQRILIANGKGLASQDNRLGPKPGGAEAPKNVREYIGGLFRGSLSLLPAPGPAEMAEYTRAAFACSPLREDQRPVSQPREANNPIPAKVGDPSPLKYCLYIIKENRTYDQVFGDLPQGNGDPELCLFPERVTPNHHALVKEFVLLDNFYVESEVSADGHEWSMAAYATDFVEKTWPLVYRGGKFKKLTYPAEGAFPIARSSGGYIWDRCREAGVSYRSYGEFVSNPGKAGGPRKARVPSLEGHFDPDFHGYDLDYPDQKRADRFIAELERFEREGDLPRFQVLRLPNDHTHGVVPGKPTPTAMVADNDLALGRVVEAVSRSKFWKETAIFVVEDDAQNGSDHVDAHRTVALVISPYTKRGAVDSSLYSTSSMLRTMELILGLKPMTQFDAAALPMYHSFQPQLDLRPFEHRPAQVSLSAVNPADGWGAKLSQTFDFSREDAADDLLLNEVVWRSVKGANSAMPAPVRAGFVFGGAEEDEDDDDDDDD